MHAMYFPSCSQSRCTDLNYDDLIMKIASEKKRNCLGDETCKLALKAQKLNIYRREEMAVYDYYCYGGEGKFSSLGLARSTVADKWDTT